MIALALGAAMLFAAERSYDDLIRAAVSSFEWAGTGVEPAQVEALVHAVIAKESGFRPDARRDEAGGDASVGLMQLLYSTAQGLGFPGPPERLQDPGTNIYLGTKLLWTLIRQLGPDLAAVVSAYNGGVRPALGFGARLTTAKRLCLARDAQGNCLRWYDAQPGEFGNQPYVDAVMSYYDYFWRSPGTTPASAGGADTRTFPWWTLAALGLGTMVAFFLRRGR